MAITLSRASYDWALLHLEAESDSDFFPKPFEIDAIQHGWPDVAPSLEQLDLKGRKWSSGRRFMAPKGQHAFRAATQLDPVDSLILAAIVFEHGAKVEARRRPQHENRVFSYRFEPQKDGLLYGSRSQWHDFWQASLDRVKKHGYEWIVIADIADYYNQIYHHVLGNQLRDSGWSQDLVRLIEINFLGTLTDGVSRGIPVGPHVVHLMAEAALIPIDDSLVGRGYDFCRFADDFHLFARSEKDAQVALFDFAEVLDQQQHLNVQNQKVRVVSRNDFEILAKSMLIDRPKNKDEEALLRVLSKYSISRYDTVSLSKLSSEELNVVNPSILSALLDLYFNRQKNLYIIEPPDYSRIGWLLRRLWQVGAPGAIDYILNNIEDFLPVLGDTTRYLVQAVTNYKGNIYDSGVKILEALSHPLVSKSEYVRMVLMNLFSSEPNLNHVDALTAMYSAAPSSMKREILLAAGQGGRGGWIRERKAEFEGADPWLRRAILATTPQLPGDESAYWVRRISSRLNGLEKLVVNWAFHVTGAKPPFSGIKLE